MYGAEMALKFLRTPVGSHTLRADEPLGNKIKHSSIVYRGKY